jgi:hypothetical protein
MALRKRPPRGNFTSKRPLLRIPDVTAIDRLLGTSIAPLLKTLHQFELTHDQEGEHTPSLSERYPAHRLRKDWAALARPFGADTALTIHCPICRTILATSEVVQRGSLEANLVDVVGVHLTGMCATKIGPGLAAELLAVLLSLGHSVPGGLEVIAIDPCSCARCQKQAFLLWRSKHFERAAELASKQAELVAERSERRQSARCMRSLCKGERLKSHVVTGNAWDTPVGSAWHNWSDVSTTGLDYPTGWATQDGECLPVGFFPLSSALTPSFCPQIFAGPPGLDMPDVICADETALGNSASSTDPVLDTQDQRGIELASNGPLEEVANSLVDDLIAAQVVLENDLSEAQVELASLRTDLSNVRAELKSGTEARDREVQVWRRAVEGLNAHLEDVAEEHRCNLCMDNDSEISVALQPCGHCSLCANCALPLKHCPWCRVPILGRVRITLCYRAPKRGC